jgi:hypothetical protein
MVHCWLTGLPRPCGRRVPRACPVVTASLPRRQTYRCCMLEIQRGACSPSQSATARCVSDFPHVGRPGVQKLSSTQTPLMGGDGPDIANSDFGGITPRNVVPSTPHALSGAAARRMFSSFWHHCCLCRLHGALCCICIEHCPKNNMAFPIMIFADIFQVLHRVLVRRQLLDARWRALQQHRGGPLLGRRCALLVRAWHMGRHGWC